MYQNLKVRRLGDRLTHLYNWAMFGSRMQKNRQAPDVIWDMCCDHGRLGLHLYQAKKGSCCVFLVDCAEIIIQKLREAYAEHVSDKLKIYCSDASEQKLSSEQCHLVIIAGVGGETAIKIISGILKRNKSSHKLSFLVSANDSMFELREYLAKTPLTLIEEKFVTEKQWSHEHLFLQFEKNPQSVVSPVGEEIWSELGESKQAYLTKLVEHHKRRGLYQACRVSNRALALYLSKLKMYEA